MIEICHIVIEGDKSSVGEAFSVIRPPEAIVFQTEEEGRGLRRKSLELDFGQIGAEGDVREDALSGG